MWSFLWVFVWKAYCATLSLIIFRSSHRPNLGLVWHPPPGFHYWPQPLKNCLYFRLKACFFSKLKLTRNPRTKDFLLFLILLSCSARVPIWGHWACQPFKAGNGRTMLGLLCEWVHCFCRHVSVHCMCMYSETSRSLTADTGPGAFQTQLLILLLHLISHRCAFVPLSPAQWDHSFPLT